MFHRAEFSEFENYSDNDYRQLRQDLHSKLIDSMEDSGNILTYDVKKLSAALESLIDSDVVIKNVNKRRLVKDIIDEIQGLGPIAELMVEPNVTDILINGPYEIWIEKNGYLNKTNCRFDDHDHLMRFLDRIVGSQGRQLDIRQPMVDTRLSDGSRLHAVIPPLSSIGPVVSIRRFQSEHINEKTLVETNFLTEEMLIFLRRAIQGGINTVISGAAGAGKTSLLNILSRYIPESERIVTIEETSELSLHHPHVISLEGRPVNSEGCGEVTLRDLVRTALRMRADRIIVGEVRGGEAIDMLQAMNVGHDGSLTTIHANSPMDVLNRLETLAMLGDSKIGQKSINKMIVSAVQLIVQVMRFHDGSRRVVSISEVDENGLCINEIFNFKVTGKDVSGALVGNHNRTCYKPIRLEALLTSKGCDLA